MRYNAVSRRPSQDATKHREEDGGSHIQALERLRDLSPESVYTLSFDKRRLRGSPSLVGRWIANPVRSAPGGSNPPPRARTDILIEKLAVVEQDFKGPEEILSNRERRLGWLDGMDG